MRKSTAFDSVVRILLQSGWAVFVPLCSVSYNKTTGGFSLFDYSGVIIDKSVDAEQKQEYIDAHKEILLL